jgi:ElaA protein
MEIFIKHFDKLTLLELYELLQLRVAVFIVEQACIYQELDGKDLSSYHVMLFKEKKLVAATRLVPPGISYENYASIGRVVSHEAHRKEGLGKLVMIESIQSCEKLFPDHKIKISAQCYLIPFYESLDFSRFGNEYLEDGIPHQAMIRHSKPSLQH